MISNSPNGDRNITNEVPKKFQVEQGNANDRILQFRNTINRSWDSVQNKPPPHPFLHIIFRTSIVRKSYSNLFVGTTQLTESFNRV